LFECAFSFLNPLNFMQIQKLMFLFTLGAFLCLGYSCGDDEDNGGDPMDCSVQRSYASDVVPILNLTCAIPNCHVNGFNDGDYTSYEDLKAQDDLGVLRGQISSGAMPRSDSSGPTELTDTQKATLLCWIDQGALDN